MPQQFTKDPDATLDYEVDWSDWLGEDTISSVAWTAPAGLTQESSENTTTTATIWLSGGTAGAYYSVVCRVTTVAGRIDDRTIVIRVADK